MVVGTTIKSSNVVYFKNIFFCKEKDKVQTKSTTRIEVKAIISKS